MVGRMLLIAGLVTMATAIPAFGQEAPTVEVEPTAVELGATTTVTGAGFDPGTVRIYFDGVTGGKPAAEHDHTGQFNFLLEVSGVTPDVHELIACNNQAPTGDCREEAIAAIVVLAPTTTTSPPRTTTTTTSTSPPRTTTTTTSAPPRTTTTVRRTTTSTPSSRPTATVASPTTASPTATAPSPTSVTATPTSTTTPGVVVATTTATGDLASLTTTTAAPISTPADVQVVGTAAPELDLSTSDDDDWPDLEVIGFEVTQGIQDLQNRMPLVADRTTWVRLYVAADRLPEDAGDDTLTAGTVGSEWSYAGWPDVTGALLLEHGPGSTVVYPENGPIVAYGDGGDRLDRDSTLNFLVPDEFLAAGELDITAFIWSQLPGTPTSQEPDPVNNYGFLTVEFQTGQEPTLFAVRLRNEDVWGAVSAAQFGAAVENIEESLLTYHPIPGATVSQVQFIIDPGPEVTEEEDPDGNWNLDERGGEPNTRLGWYHGQWDTADDEYFVGVVPHHASSEWAGMASSWNHAFWTVSNTTTPAHEMGHVQGLRHVPCKDTDEPIGVADELVGGSLDLSHPNGLPGCSLAPTDRDGYYGFNTRQELPTVYSNDPTGSNVRFPLMGYRGGKWSDAYHNCRLLDSYGVACDPAAIGLPPLAQVADFGQQTSLVQVESGTGTWEPMLPGDTHDGPIVLFELSWESCDAGLTASPDAACAASATGDGTTEHFFTVEIAEGPVAAECAAAASSGGSNTAAPSTTVGTADMNIGIGELQECTISKSAPAHSECEGSTSGSGTNSAPATTSPPTTNAPGPPRYVLAPCWVTSWSTIGPALVIGDPTSGATGLLERQLELTGAAPAAAVGAADLNELGLAWQTGLPAPFWVLVSDSSGGVPGRMMPLRPDLAGEGGELAGGSGVFAAPWSAAYDTIRVVRADGRLLDTVSATDVPDVRVDRVDVAGREVTVAWSGEDPDGDPLLYSVSMSADGGATWRPMEALTDATTFTVTDEHQAAGGDAVVVRVTATDGLATSTADSEPFRLPDAAPNVSVNAPGPTVPRYAPQTLTASAYDPEDGVIEAITWTSSLDGTLGVGRRVATRWLTLGVHEITVSVVDSAGATARDTLVLEVIDDGRARPLVAGDLPEVDELLRAAVGDRVERGASDLRPPTVATSLVSDGPASTAQGAGADRSGSNVGLTVLAIAGVGMAGVGLGATARRRRNGELD